MTDQTFLVFHDFGSFEEHWSDILWNVPQLGFMCVVFFFMGFWEEDHREEMSFSPSYDIM